MKRTKAGLLFFYFLATLAFGAGSCEDPDEPPPVQEPMPSAIEAGNLLKKEFPRVRIFFSKRTGQILWIDGAGTALARGSVATAKDALGIVHKFIEAHPYLFRVSQPEQNLIAPSSSLRTEGLAHGVVSLRFEQAQGGIPILGQHGIAYFDASGAMVGLSARLLPSADFDRQRDAAGAISTTSQALSLGFDRRDSEAPALQRRHVWARLSRLDPYRIMEERLETDGINVTRKFIDPSTGKVLRERDETASELGTATTTWKTQPSAEVPAHDLGGALWHILSTADAGKLMLSFGLAEAGGAFVTVADSGSLSNRGSIPTRPLTTDQPDWTQEPAYESQLRAATGLAAHVRTAMVWYGSGLGHKSWDGKGGAFYTSIRGHRSEKPAPEFNAWGGNGRLLIGDGLSPTGRAPSDALDIVAHEFTHSVIDATAGFTYNGESGALNESLADIFGKSVEGFPNTTMGKAAGVVIRDLLNPASCTPDCDQPGTYSQYVSLPDTEDAGGVHTNSGIMNRALSLAILRDVPADQVAGRAQSVSSILLGAMKEIPFAEDSRFEEFAAGVSAYCLARKSAGSLEAGQQGLCEAFERGFTDTEVLGNPL
jgi:Zn-dependent metalloprotease